MFCILGKALVLGLLAFEGGGWEGFIPEAALDFNGSPIFSLIRSSWIDFRHWEVKGCTPMLGETDQLGLELGTSLMCSPRQLIALCPGLSLCSRLHHAASMLCLSGPIFWAVSAHDWNKRRVTGQV